MARIAFIMDRIFRRFGLSGKSFIPMLVGVGCGVPGVMASRTIENDRDRKMTIMTTTFIPCGAKMPIVALIAGALFGGSAWVATSAYFMGVAAIISSGIILKKTKMFAGEPAPFVMELPAYHMPTIGIVLRSMWERGWSFIKKAGTHHPFIHHLHLVYLQFWHGRRTLWHGGRPKRRFPGGDRKRDCMDLCAAWLGRLEISGGSDHRAGGKRERGGNLWHPLWILGSRGRWGRSMGNPRGKHDGCGGLFVPRIQPSVRALLCGHGRNQAGDEQCQVVLVCDRISDASGLCGVLLRLPVRTPRYWRRFYSGTVAALIVLVGMLYLLFRPAPKEETLNQTMPLTKRKAA